MVIFHRMVGFIYLCSVFSSVATRIQASIFYLLVFTAAPEVGVSCIKFFFSIANLKVTHTHIYIYIYLI